MSKDKRVKPRDPRAAEGREFALIQPTGQFQPEP